MSTNLVLRGDLLVLFDSDLVNTSGREAKCTKLLQNGAFEMNGKTGLILLLTSQIILVLL